MDGPKQGEQLASKPDASAAQPTLPRPPASKSGEYVVVARRYRPQSFGELVGQNSIGRALSNAILANRVGHAYLFTGARGVGKTSSARILAKCLNCVHGPTPTPCNECDICLAISSGEDVDVLEIDGASNRGIDEIRELRQNVNVRPSRSRFKIYIIDEVHMLTTPAFNALLKTLEEPPEHVKFIFCTTEAEKIPITILSRCQRFDFAGINVGEIAERLRQIAENEGVTAEPEALELLARRAAGSMRDSQSLLEQLLAFGGDRISVGDVHAMLGTAGDKRLGQILEHLVARQPGAALQELDEALGEGVDVGQIVGQLLGILRDCLVAAVGAPPERFLHVGPSGQAVVQNVASRFGVNTTLAAMQILDHTLGRMRYSTHGRTLAELALVRISGLEDLEQLSTLIGRLNEERFDDEAGGEAAAPGPTALLGDGSKKKPDAAALTPPQPSSLPNSRPTPLSPPRGAGTAPASSASAVVEIRPMAAIGTSFALPTSPPPAERPAAAVRTLADVNAELNSDDGEAGGGLAAQARTPVEPLALTSDASNLWDVWRRALERLEDTTGDYARKVEKLELPADTAISGPKQLVASFPTKYTSCKSVCERPDRLERLVSALSETAGGEWLLRFEILPPTAGEAERAAGRPAPRRDLIAEKSQHPLVQKAVELFRARVARVEEANGQT